MDKREYIVILKKDIDYAQFWDDMEHLVEGAEFVPTRAVDIVYEKPGSLRSCHYSLSFDEAAQLKLDPRVLDVHLPLKDMEGVGLKKTAFQTGNFSKPVPASSSGSNINWGVIRGTTTADPYATALTPDTFPYTLDGDGVDVVIIDSGIQVDHPEFKDKNGAQRIQTIDWYSASGVPGTMPANFYRDYDGHGTHVAGIAAGKTYGWAKSATIYSMKLAGLEGAGDSGTGIDISEAFDLIKMWHTNKPAMPGTGAKRPTVVNMSFGFFSYYSNIDEISYRGQSKTGTEIDTEGERWNLGLVPMTDGIVYYAPFRATSIDTDLEELIDAGVIVTIAAGNFRFKIDIVSGLDYDNYYRIGTDNFYYHRGGSPFSDRAIIVGAMSSLYVAGDQESRAEFSNAGPGVSVYAAGEDIISCTSTINTSPNDAVYFLNNTYRQENLSGTSMAAPQVCGVLATWLQLYPTLSSAAALSGIINNAAQNVLFDTGLSNDYTSLTSLYGGENLILNTRYTSGYILQIKGP